MKDFLKNLVDESVTKADPNRWPTYDGDTLNRNDFVTASEVGSCMRKIWYDKNTTPSEGNGAVTWGYFERGHSVEAWVVKKLRERLDQSVTFMLIGDDQVSFHKGNRSGTPDGIMVHPDGNVLFDIKSIDPRTNVKNLPKQEHVDQVLYNIELVEECIGMEIVSGKLLYVDASNFQRMLEFDVAYDVDRVEELCKRAEIISQAMKGDDLPPEGIYNGGCTYCNHGAICSAAVEQKSEHIKNVAKKIGVAGNVFK